VAEFIKLLYSALNDYGFAGVIGVGCILVFLALAYELGKTAIRRFFFRHKVKPSKKKPIVYESLFFPIVRRLIDHDVDQKFNLKCPKRQAMFRDLLKAKFNSMLEVLSELVKTDVDSMTTVDFRTYWIDALARYSTEWQNNAKVEGIPEIAITLYNEYHEKNDEIIYAFTNSVIDADNVHDSNTEKSIEILNMISTVNRISMKDARDAADAFNGELDDMVYKGYGKCDTCPRRSKCERFKDI